MYTAKQFRRYFFRGMAALLPTILTLWLFVACYNFVQNNISSHINHGFVYLLSFATDHYPSVSDEEVRSYVITHDQSWLNRPDELKQEIKKPEVQRSVRQARLDRFWVNGVGSVAGFIVALVGVCFMGVVLASVAGKALWVIIESVLVKTPVLKSVYPHVKQMTDFLFSDQKLSFSRVIAVQYPRKGVWSVGMVTGSGLRRLERQSRCRDADGFHAGLADTVYGLYNFGAAGRDDRSGYADRAGGAIFCKRRCIIAGQLCIRRCG